MIYIHAHEMEIRPRSHEAKEVPETLKFETNCVGFEPFSIQIFGFGALF